jgi:hypothetical protein
MNASRSAAIVNVKRKIPRGGRSASGGNGLSPRRGRRLRQPNKNMRRKSVPSIPRRPLSRNERKPRMPAGRRRDADSIKPSGECECDGN